jgi:(p)ppGpp synthase/HD superfamily hydrolase
MPKEEHSTSSYNPFLSRRFYLALDFAAGLHHSQCRKGTNIPYIVHLMSVCAIVLENGGDEDLAIAALLHDAAEDQGGRPTLEPIRQLFGDRVAEVVAECSDTDQVPKPPWRERKEAYLAHLRSASADARLISAADKLSNLRNILADYRQLKEDLWGRFNAKREDQLWFYRSVIFALREADSNPIVDEMESTFGQLEELIAGKLPDK